MDFANERYVRLYVRETTTWKLLPWQAQAILPQLLRLVDRAGVLDLGGVSPAEGVAASLAKWPLDVVTVGIEAILAKEILEHRDDCLVWPTFMDAQEATQSDRQRQAEARARRRDLARSRVTNRDEMSRDLFGGAEQARGEPTGGADQRTASVTTRDKESRTVTDGHETDQNRHAVSRGVTPSVPSRTKETPPTPSREPEQDRGVGSHDPGLGNESTNGNGHEPTPDVATFGRVLEVWVDAFGPDRVESEHDDGDLAADLEERIAEEPRLGQWMYLCDQVKRQPFLAAGRASGKLREGGPVTLAWVVHTKQRMHAVLHMGYAAERSARGA